MNPAVPGPPVAYPPGHIATPAAPVIVHPLAGCRGCERSRIPDRISEKETSPQTVPFPVRPETLPFNPMSCDRSCILASRYAALLNSLSTAIRTASPFVT